MPSFRHKKSYSRRRDGLAALGSSIRASIAPKSSSGNVRSRRFHSWICSAYRGYTDCNQMELYFFVRERICTNSVARNFSRRYSVVTQSMCNKARRILWCQRIQTSASILLMWAVRGCSQPCSLGGSIRYDYADYDEVKLHFLWILLTLEAHVWLS